MRLMILMIAMSSQISWALPASARLFQVKYGYRVSCQVCHFSHGGSAINDFGKAFLKMGGNSVAFPRIEGLDSDGDSVPNLKEILSKSNPGDKLSFPGAAGSWLDHVSSVVLPARELDVLFPGHKKFSAIEGALSAAQWDRHVQLSIVDPPEEDRVPTFYFSEIKGKKEWVGQILPSYSKTGLTLVLGVVTNSQGLVSSVQILGGHLVPRIIMKEDLLSRYEGQNLHQVSEQVIKAQRAKNEHDEIIARAVLRSLSLSQIVFGKSQ